MRKGAIIRMMGKAGLTLAMTACALPVFAFDSSTAKTASQAGFLFPASGPISILVLESDTKVTEQSAAGMPMPNSDWTSAAREALGKALDSGLAEHKSKMEILPALSPSDNALVHDYRTLFGSIAQSVISYKLLPDDRLPTKDGRFDWTMGSGIAQLDRSGTASYGLFYGTADSYASRARTSVETVQAALGMEADKGEHRGYVGLVDMKTGDLLWFKVDVRMSGDVRTNEGAKRRIAQLLAGFPKRGEAQ